MNEINKQEIKYTYSKTYIVLTIFLYLILFIAVIYCYHSMKEIEKIRNPDTFKNIEWYYSCPDYVYDYYNCNTTKFMNLTGKYCGKVLTCENSYKIISTISEDSYLIK